MWKTPSSKKDLLRALKDSLGARLPNSWTLRVEEHPSTPGGRPDAVLAIEAPDGESATLAVEAKIGLPPGRVAQAVQQARSYGLESVMVVSSFISPTARRLLTEQGASYADTTGNLRIALDHPALLIEMHGADRSPWPDTRAIRSLKGPSAGRVIRALVDYRPPYILSRLAELAGASLGTVYRVLDFLETEALLQRKPRGAVTDIDWTNLLRRWAQDYSLIDSNVTRNFLAPRGIPDLVDRVRRWDGRVAITGSLAAARLIPAAPSRLAVLFVDDILRAGEALDLREVDAGANTILVEPFDEVVFGRASGVDGIVYAAASQVAADLLTSPGRGPSEAEDVLMWMARNESAWRS